MTITLCLGRGKDGGKDGGIDRKQLSQFGLFAEQEKTFGDSLVSEQQFASKANEADQTESISRPAL